MAEPLARSAAIRLLEDAVGLLRQVRFSVFLTHWLGSVPLALALLVGWTSVTNTRTTDAFWAGESLILALLLLWMNCCRTVYAGSLRRHLSGAAGVPWSARRAFRMAAIQSFYGATKLVVLPFCLLILFPWAKVVAFYRTLAVVADRADLSPREVTTQARRLAGYQPAQNWAVLALLLLLQVLVTLNLAMALALLPQIVRILTGYESAYSRSGMYFVSNPMFVLLVLAVSWLVFDPFAQAVYCLRSFEAESMETGEDLRCGLRRIRATAGVVAALVLLMTVAPRARADVSPAQLQKSVEQAMQAPEYDWRFPPAPAAANAPAIVRFVDRLITAMRRVAEGIGQVVGRLLRWLFDRLFPKTSGNPKGGPPGAGLDWTVAALLALVVCAGALFAWQRQRRRSRPTMEAAAPVSAVRIDAPDLTADALPEDRWLELADRFTAEQNFRFALRALYLGSLAWLGRREMLSIHPGKTNRDYQIELNRRARGFPAARGLFAGNINAFERAWYGQHAVSAEETTQFRERADHLKAALASPPGVAS